MKRILVGAFALALSASPIIAQSLEDLNIQIHGYATQGFLYSTNDNWNSTASTDGSPAWTEAVFNITAQPSSKLRVGVQERYSMYRAGWRSLVFSGQASMPKNLDPESAVVEFVAHNAGAIGYIGKATPHEGVKVIAVK
jgi:hypothetical protein